MLSFECQGETLVAMPDGALWWPSQQTAFVADVHLGKAESFRALSIPVPHGTTHETLARLDRLVCQTSVERLVFLGDLWHARAGRTERIDEAFLTWRHGHAELEVTLVEGNHDRRAGRAPDGARVDEVLEGTTIGPFVLCHYPDPSERGYVLAGHLHPAVVLDGRAAQSLRLPCFWFGEQVGVLPSFGDFTGHSCVRPRRGDRVFVLADDRVIAVA